MLTWPRIEVIQSSLAVVAPASKAVHGREPAWNAAGTGGRAASRAGRMRRARITRATPHDRRRHEAGRQNSQRLQQPLSLHDA
jgi:hypothetical protein